MKLNEALKKKNFVVTSEVQSPVEDPEFLLNNLKRIKGRVDGVSVTESEFDAVVGDTIKICERLKQDRFDAIYQTAARNKNRLDLERDLISAYKAGINNILVFTEDYRITGDSLHEIMFFHVDSGKLSSVLNHLKQGQTVEGNELEFNAEFTMGSGIESSWGSNVPDLEMKEIEEMTNIGTAYFLTTPVFDLDSFEKFMKQVQSFDVPVIAEVMIIRTAGMATFLNRHFKSGTVPDHIIARLSKAPDKFKESVDIFADLVNGLKELCQGVHIITTGGEDKLKYYLDAAKLR